VATSVPLTSTRPDPAICDRMKPDPDVIRRHQQQSRETAQRLHLSLRMGAATAAGFRVQYAIENLGPTAVLLLDDMLQFAREEGVKSAPETAIAARDDASTTVLQLSVGFVAPESNVAYDLLPGAHRLEAGTRCEGAVVVPFPLRSWHPNEGAAVLTPAPSVARLRVGVLPAFCALTDLELSDGRHAHVPRRAEAFLYQQWLQSEPFAIPVGE
jgi:hypothetical protein